MCAHPPEARRTRVVTSRGYVCETSYCPLCQVEQQRVRRAKDKGRLFGINEYLTNFAQLPVIHE